MPIESDDDHSAQLTDEQVEEVRRRQADASAATLTLAEFDERLRRLASSRELKG